MVGLDGMGLAGGVFVMIYKLSGGDGYLMESGGINVFFVRAETSPRAGDIRLYSVSGGISALLCDGDKGFKARVRELKSKGLLE